MARGVKMVFSLAVMSSAPLFAGLFLFARDIALLGHQWVPAVPAVRLLAVYGFAYGSVQTVQLALKANGRPRADWPPAPRIWCC